MSEIVLKDTKVFFGGHDIGGQMNNITINYTAEILDRTAFGSSFRKRRAGLQNAEISGSGFYHSSGIEKGTTSGKPDPVLFGKTGSTVVMSIIPEGSAPNNISYFGKMSAAEYSPGGTIGELLGFTFAAQGAGNKFVRGKHAITDDVTEDSNEFSTELNLGTNSTKDKVWAALHVLNVDTTQDTIQVAIKGSSEANFGTETAYLSFSLTDDDVGQGFSGSTRVKSTKHSYYRAATTDTGTYKVSVSIGVK
jgi:hypothetical protein